MLKDNNSVRDTLFFITLLFLIRNVSVTSSTEKQHQNKPISIFSKSETLQQATLKLMQKTKSRPQLNKQLVAIKNQIDTIQNSIKKESHGLFLTGPLGALLTPVKEHNIEKKLFKISIQIGKIINKILEEEKSSKKFSPQKNLNKNLNLISQALLHI